MVEGEMELEVPQTTFAHVNLPHGYRLHSHSFAFSDSPGCFVLLRIG